MNVHDVRSPNSVAPQYSVIVPFHNEEEIVAVLYSRLKEVMDQVGASYELVFVDDGSTDLTFKMLKGIAAIDSRVLVIKLRRNFGPTSALAAGFDRCSGTFVISMDGDLRHDPNDIPAFLEALQEGYDVVSGWHKDRTDKFSLERISSRCANWLMAKVSGVPIHDFGTTFKAYRRDVIQNIPLYGEMHRLIPALASWHGISICEIRIKNVIAGQAKSQYGLGRTFRVVLDLLTVRFLLRYISRPMHLFGRLGMLSLLASAVFAMIFSVVKYAHPQVALLEVHAPLVVIAAVLSVAGVQLTAVGLIGELLVRHHYTNQQPAASYALEQVVRIQSDEDQKS